MRYQVGPHGGISALSGGVEREGSVLVHARRKGHGRTQQGGACHQLKQRARAGDGVGSTSASDRELLNVRSKRRRLSPRRWFCYGSPS